MREVGYYWVKDDGIWEVMRWNGSYFQDTYGITMSEHNISINEERIKTPDEK